MRWLAKPIGDDQNVTRYGARHQAMRAEMIARMSPGQACARCGRPMWAGEDLQLDHDDTDPSGQTYLGLVHARCNLSAGARKGNRARAAAYRAAVGLPSLDLRPDSPPGRREPTYEPAYDDAGRCAQCHRSDCCRLKRPHSRCW
jgi:hypothetical protein